MADQEFEEFSRHLDQLPQHLRAHAQSYKLVHAITPMEENKSFLEKVQMGQSLCGLKSEDKYFGRLLTSSGPSTMPDKFCPDVRPRPNIIKNHHRSSQDQDFEGSDSSDDEGLPTANRSKAIRWHDNSSDKSRKLKIMPSFTTKTIKANDPEPEKWITALPDPGSGLEAQSTTTYEPKMRPTSLLEELSQAEQHRPIRETHQQLFTTKPEDYDVEGPCDVDSGNSTNHSPDEVHKHLLAAGGAQAESALSPSLMTTQLELLDPTHRGLHRFLPRHQDEIEIDIGDPIYVQKEADDLWCEGANLRTGQRGIFPLAHVVDVDYNDFDPHNHHDDRKERYLLQYLASMETHQYKGNVVLCQAVKKIATSSTVPQPHSTVLEISDRGIKMIDKSRVVTASPCHDYFFALKNVTFCGFHPFDARYFGFVSKHPRMPKYACHVFFSQRSTQPVAEACGRAFQRFYQKFIETAFPVEDIYLE